MQKKYIVRLSEAEQAHCVQVISKLKGSSQKVRRAQLLLKADVNGAAGWPDSRIAEAFNCRTQTVENLRKRLVTEGFELALNGQPRSKPPRRARLDGAGEAKLIALRMGSPPAGFAHWTLRLLGDQLVELGVVESISPETVRQTLKKTV